MLGAIVDIHEHSKEIVAELCLTVLPNAMDDLGFPGKGAKALLKFLNCLANNRPRHGLAVIKLQR